MEEHMEEVSEEDMDQQKSEHKQLGKHHLEQWMSSLIELVMEEDTEEHMELQWEVWDMEILSQIPSDQLPSVQSKPLPLQII